jgi:hypothetical protein
LRKEDVDTVKPVEAFFLGAFLTLDEYGASSQWLDDELAGVNDRGLDVGSGGRVNRNLGQVTFSSS